MVTTFVLSAGNRTKGVWKFLEKVSRANIRLVELEHPSLRKIMSYCSAMVPIYIHPYFHKSLKLRFFLDVGGLSRDGRVTTEFGTGSLRHAVSILTLDDFQAIVDSE